MGAKFLEEEHPQKAFGWAARDSSGVLSPFNFSRRANGEEDVTIKILFCGICHTDLHLIKDEVGMTIYPIVPGHEITGVITQVGCNVQRLQVGDKVGVGCLVGACHECDNCNQWMENFCPKCIRTYNSIYNDGTITYGRYSDYLVVHHRYVVRFPENVPLDAGAPLLCAGITVYSPMRGFGIDKPGMHLGVVGLGGLGHVAVKFGKALGMKITIISTSPSKEADAIKRLGADGFLVSSNLEQMQAASGTMDGIINTAIAPHLISPLVDLLKNYGKLIMLAGTQKPSEIPILQLLMGRKIVAGSAIGGLKETQEMIDFAGKHNITADVEVIPMDYVNTAMERLAKGDVHYRFVIDVANTMAAESTHPSRLHAKG